MSTPKIISEVVVDTQINDAAATALIETVGSIVGERECELELLGG